MNRPHFRRRPRPTDPEPEYSRLDRLDGLPTRYDAEWPSVLAAEVGTVVGVSADEWSSLPPVFAPHSFVGGDLAAMAAPLPGMARDDLGTYAEPVVVHIEADTSAFRDAMASITRAVGLTTAEIEATQRARADLQDAWTKPAPYAEPVKPRGRHRQTDPLDLILADLRDLDGL